MYVALCKLLTHNYSHLKQLYVLNKTTHFSYKLGVVRMGIKHVFMCLKEDLAWTTYV